MAKIKICENQMTTKLARQLFLLMKEGRISQKKLAKIAGVSASTLHGWLTGRSPTQFDALKKISDHFGISLAELLTNSPDKSVLQGRSQAENADVKFVLDSKTEIIIEGTGHLILKKRR